MFWVFSGVAVRVSPALSPTYFEHSKPSKALGIEFVSLSGQVDTSTPTGKMVFTISATVADLFVLRGLPEHLRSDHGPEFCAPALREWLGRIGVKTLDIEPGSPWENGYCESFNGKLRDECLTGEIFYSLLEAQIVIEQWKAQYNTLRPHSALGYRPPAPAAGNPYPPPRTVPQLRPVM